MANPGPVPDEVLEELIKVGQAHAAGQPVSDAEATFFLFAAPELLQELLHHRHAQAGIEWNNRPTNVIELALARPQPHILQPEGAA